MNTLSKLSLPVEEEGNEHTVGFKYSVLFKLW
jgi:hypothetical protein